MPTSLTIASCRSRLQGTNSGRKILMRAWLRPLIVTIRTKATQEICCSAGKRSSTTSPTLSVRCFWVEPRRKQMVDELFAKYPPEIQSAILKPATDRTPIEWQMYHKAKPYMNPSAEEVVDSLKEKEKSRWLALKDELAKYADLYPGEL